MPEVAPELRGPGVGHRCVACRRAYRVVGVVTRYGEHPTGTAPPCPYCGAAQDPERPSRFRRVIDYLYDR